jgi:hypothetical protein
LNRLSDNLFRRRSGVGWRGGRLRRCAAQRSLVDHPHQLRETEHRRLVVGLGGRTGLGCGMARTGGLSVAGIDDVLAARRRLALRRSPVAGTIRNGQRLIGRESLRHRSIRGGPGHRRARHQRRTEAG